MCTKYGILVPPADKLSLVKRSEFVLQSILSDPSRAFGLGVFLLSSLVNSGSEMSLRTRHVSI